MDAIKRLTTSAKTISLNVNSQKLLLAIFVAAAMLSVFGTGVDALNISFISPTDANNTYVNRNYTYINTSIDNSTNSIALLDWNNSLVGLWRFNEGSGTFTSDSSSNNNNAISCWNGSTSSAMNCNWIAGKFGNGVNIRVNASEVLSVTNATSSIYNPRNEITVGGWFNISNLSHTAPYPALIDKADNAGYYIYIDPTQTNGTKVHFALAIANTTNRIDAGFPDTTYDAWHMVYITYSNTDGKVKLYLDGVNVNNATLGGQLNLTTGYALFFADGNAGGVGGGNNGGYAGQVDEIMLFNRELSSEEINASYNAGSYRLYRNFTSLNVGKYSYIAYVQNTSGIVNQTEKRNIVIYDSSSSFNLTSSSAKLYDTSGNLIDDSVPAQITSTSGTSIKFNSSQNYTGTNWQIAVSGNVTGKTWKYKAHNDNSWLTVPAANISYNGTHTLFNLQNINVSEASNSNELATDDTLRLISSTIVYPSSTSNTFIGNMFDSSINNTYSIFGVLFLLIVVVIIAVILARTKGFDKNSGGQSGMW